MSKQSPWRADTPEIHGHLICRDVLSSGQGEAPTGCGLVGASVLGSGACAGVRVMATRGLTDMRGLVTAGRCFRLEWVRLSSIERRVRT